MYMRQRMSGQALTEMLIACIAVLIPMFVFGWALNGYASARNTAVAGARYAAWERTIWFNQAPKDTPTSGANTAVKSQARIEADMIERVFLRERGPSSQPNAIRSHPKLPPTAVNSKRLHWLQTYLPDDNVTDVERANSSGMHEGMRPRLELVDSGLKTSTGVADILENIGKVGSLGGGPGIDLENRGLWKANVDLKTNALNIAAFSNGSTSHLPAVTFRESAAVLTNTWSVAGPKHEVSRVEPLVPLSLLNVPFVDKLLDVVGLIVSPLGDWQPGYVAPDRLPVDRRR